MRHLFLSASLLICTLTTCMEAADAKKSNQKEIQKQISQNISYDPTLLESESHLIPVAVIGSGTAGLAAAASTAKKGHYTVVFQGQNPRGKLNNDVNIVDFPGLVEAAGKKIIHDIEKQATKKGAYLCPKTIVSVDFSNWPFVLKTNDGKTAHALCVIIATGSSIQPLRVEGEKEYLGNGVTSAVERNDKNFKAKRVFVVGSGEDAIKKAMRVASNAADVSILVKEDKLQVLPADAEDLQTRFPNVHLLYNAELKKIEGKEGRVHKIILKNGRSYACEAVVIAGENAPNSNPFKKHLSCDPQGHILLEGRSQACSVKGIFACGSVTNMHYKKQAISFADGMKAGIDATQFLRTIGLTKEAEKNLQPRFFKGQ